ncbi:MAG: GreA/GreB family elongation factor [Labilithrix sp.]|nr:GreA/GreB family elongation factor [Labilithrix sp.]MCW5810888.1 GreA/GreB family elongation factor [Labilithrix sp.]
MERADRIAVKGRLVGGLVAKLEAELANMRRAAKDAREAATHEEAKPENDKDTRALEASYLAGAQAARVRELEGSIKLANAMAIVSYEGKAIQAAAVVTLEDDDDVRSVFFVAPVGGGYQLAEGDLEAQVVTPTSPLGRALLGKTQGDVIEMRSQTLRGPGPLREMTIVDVW